MSAAPARGVSASLPAHSLAAQSLQSWRDRFHNELSKSEHRMEIPPQRLLGALVLLLLLVLWVWWKYLRMAFF